MNKKHVYAAILLLITFALAGVGYWGYVRHSRTKALLLESRQQQQDDLNREYDELTFETMRSADDIRIRNLKAEDDIAHLEGRPAKNRIAIAELESKWEFDDLYKQQEAQLIRLIALNKRDPELNRIMFTPVKALLDGVVEMRRVNLTGDEKAKKQAKDNVNALQQNVLTIAQAYQDALDAHNKQQSQTATRK